MKNSYFKPNRCPTCNGLPAFRKIYAKTKTGKSMMVWVGECQAFLKCKREEIVVNHNKGIAISDWNLGKFFKRSK